MTTFTSGTTSVTIAINPIRPLSLPSPGSLVDGIDSNGDRYAYARQPRHRTVTLTFATVTDAELTDLQALIKTTVAGSRKQFTWNDGAENHSVRYVSHSWQRKGPGWHRVELQLQESM